MNIPYKGSSLRWRILLASSLAVSLVFALTGWMIQRYAAAVSEHSLEEEMRTSLHSYQMLWNARIRHLAEISRIMSSMSDVRAAFMTRDRATIQDTAKQLWSQISEQDASFLVLDPTGQVIASLGGLPEFSVSANLVSAARRRFPRQVSGYARQRSHLYYLVLTPVYVEAENEPALLNVLLIAFDIDEGLAQELKRSTNGSDFAFVSAGQVIASTLPNIDASHLRSSSNTQGNVSRFEIQGNEYLLLGADLQDTEGKRTGELFVIRSFAGPQATIAELRRNVAVFWIAGIVVALALTNVLFRRVLKPVRTLDRAAEEVIRRNYDYRVPVETNDELGRLAKTFNQMCDSIRNAREDLIRQEQIATIGRLSSSIVHDLRNPLAAIYGGAEMLVDAELSSDQQRRLAANIYSASRRIQELLQELLDVSRVKSRAIEACKLVDIVTAAREALAQGAEMRSVQVKVSIPETLEVVVSRDRLERVFINLIDNAFDAMPDGGKVEIGAHIEKGKAIVSVQDTGPGISEQAWPNLFRPFASFGKKNGLGLGLALSRQALLDSGGDLWVEKHTGTGAKFLMRLPLAVGSEPKTSNDKNNVLQQDPV